jgi:tetratricopeptide (TPR) repeat protein
VQERQRIFCASDCQKLLLKQELATNNTRTCPSLGPFWHSIISTAAHALVGEICLRYLFFVDFEIVPEEFGDNPWGDNITKDRFCSSHPFFLYGASYWQLHVYQSGSDRTCLMEEKAWLLCDTRTLRFWTWFYIADHRWAVKAATETSVAYYFPLGVFLRTMDRPKEDPSSRNQGSAIVDKVQPLAWAVSEGHLTVAKILICHLAVTICIKNQSSASKIFHQAVVACATGSRNSHRLAIARLLIEGGVLVSFGDSVMTSRWPSSQQWLDTVLSDELLKLPQPISNLDDQIATFLSELRFRLRESRNAFRMREGIPSQSPIISTCNVSTWKIPFRFRWSATWKEVNEISSNDSDVTSSSDISAGLGDFSVQHKIAQNLAKYGQYDEAITLYASVLGGLANQGGLISTSLNILCKKNMNKAIAALGKERQKAWLEPELWNVLNGDDEAQGLASEGKHKEAIPIYEQVLATLYKLHGDYDHEILTCVENLAISMGNIGHLTETKELQGFVLKGYLLRYGGYHPLTAGSLRNLGVTLYSEKKYQLAEACFRWAANVYADTLGVDSSAATLCFNDLKGVQNTTQQVAGWPASL